VKVIVIGCGPAGLAAAHAAVGQGADVTIYAPGGMTPQRGPLLLQRPIPGINTEQPNGTIHQIVIGGSILDYRYKLYGDVNIGINGDVLQKCYHAWDHFETYQRLWNTYGDLVVTRWVKRNALATMHEEADLVVSTASARSMCRSGQMLGGGVHEFKCARVAVTPYTSYPDQPDNTIIFNANPDAPWVRSSLVFGVPVTEWIPSLAPNDATLIEKPIATDCRCYPHVLRTGRFGAWRNETWVDTAYWDTYSAISSMKRAPELDSIK
jgi:hypothetical protein